MERTGKFKSYINGDITFTVGQIIPEELERLRKADVLDIKAVKHREKRSLNANAYFHKLVSLIADALHTSDVEVKNRLIREYGPYMYVNGKIPTYAIKEDLVDAMLNMDGIHWIVENKVPVEEGRIAMALKRGSHSYNSKEFARLIDGTVEEAKSLGIETLPPDELKRMYAMIGEKE